jgi:flagellar assembly protein FliH
VGDEERKSLSKSENQFSEDGQRDLGLHCFPDIPDGQSADVRQCLSEEDNFRRVQYNSSEANQAKTNLRFDDDRTCDIKKGTVTTAQLSDYAYQRGFADGRKKGMADAEIKWTSLERQKIEPLLMSLQEMLSQLNNIRKETYQEIEKEVVELALAIAKQVICQEVTLNQDIVACVAREALAKVEDPGRIKIKMNPSDLEFINQTKSQMKYLLQNMDNVTLEAEEQIQCGGCIIETDLGEIDARIERQLQAVEESFQAAIDKF